MKQFILILSIFIEKRLSSKPLNRKQNEQDFCPIFENWKTGT